MSTEHIEGTSEINLVTDYLRPLSCALLNLENNYLAPYNVMYAKVADSFSEDNLTKVVSDGQSGDAFSRLTGKDVKDVSETIQSISDTITNLAHSLRVASDSEAFTTNSINLRGSGTGGCAC